MRISFIVLAFVAICGCRFSYPYMNLRHPIYMVTDKSFWDGCDKDPYGEEVCHEYRIAQVRDGVDDWFRHFDEPNRPEVIIVGSQSELPRDVFNAVIYLQIKAGGCNDSEKHDACYHVERSKKALPVIVFDTPEDIYPSLVEHEFGHALGLNHMDPEKGIYSIMLPKVKLIDYVLPVDIDSICELHGECPPYENTWCKGGFYDKDRCPSASYEEGEARYQAEVEDEE